MKETEIQRQFKEKYKVAILGAGNGGQAMAGYLASRNHEVRLYNRSLKNGLNKLDKCTISCFGAMTCKGNVAFITDNINEAVSGAEIIIVTTTSNAHKEIAASLSDCLENNQTVLLSPGRTGGAFEFRRSLDGFGKDIDAKVAETESLVYACRLEKPGNVKIIGIKNQVPVAAFPACDTNFVISQIKNLYSSFVGARNVMEISLQNVGSIFHPSIMLFNASSIESNNKFYFYQDVTPTIVDFIKQLDEERIALGKAYGINLLTVEEWILKTYPDSVGENLYELMRSNPAYYKIRAPSSLDSRYINEDIPYGLVPYVSFGKAAGLKMPLMTSLINLSCALLKRDFWTEGRTLEKMGFAGKTPDEIISML